MYNYPSTAIDGEALYLADISCYSILSDSYPGVLLVPDSLVPKLHIWSENMESILVVKQAEVPI
jgi:hypothetical protein